MNGRRARQIRNMAWTASLEAATRTGDGRFIRAGNLRVVNKRIKRYFMRHRAFPASVEPQAGRLDAAFARRRA